MTGISHHLEQVLKSHAERNSYPGCRIYMTDATWTQLKLSLTVTFPSPTTPNLFLLGLDVLIDNDLSYGYFELRKVLSSTHQSVLIRGRALGD